MRDLRPRGPEPKKLFEVTGPVHLLPGDRTVNDNLMARDMLQDALVGRRRPPHIVFRLQPVDRNGQNEPRNRRPLSGDLPHGARDELRDHPTGRQVRENRVQLPITNEWFSADNRDVEGSISVDDPQHAVD